MLSMQTGYSYWDIETAITQQLPYHAVQLHTNTVTCYIILRIPSLLTDCDFQEHTPKLSDDLLCVCVCVCVCISASYLSYAWYKILIFYPC